MSKKYIDQFIQNALKEDIGEGDHTTLATIPKNTMGKAKLLIKEDGVIAGIEEAVQLFKAIDKKSRITTYLHDGQQVHKGQVAFVVSAPIHTILKAERLVLNIMQRMSGIATKTAALVEKVKGYPCTILDTRKTTPGMRFLEKKAVKTGGGKNHRMGLYDMILLKDNHIDFSGGITTALRKTQNYLKEKKKKLFIIVEARTLADVREILACGCAGRILLDNFTPAMTKKAVKIIGKKMQIESSGRINARNIRHYAACGVDFISIGSLTNHIHSLDLSLKADIEK